MSVDKIRWGTLLTVGFGVALVIMDATIVNVALPVVMSDLQLTGADAQWLNASYALTFAALLVTVGRLGDQYGRRRLFALGIGIFMVASVFAGSAESAAMLIGARFVQGVGAALVVPSTLSILNATFTGRARGIAFAVWGSPIGGMAALGPLAGGWLATNVSWRWAFWLNIPLGLLILLGILRAVPESRDPEVQAGTDWIGAVLSMMGMGAIVFALIEGSWFGWWRQEDGSWSPVPGALAGGLAVMVVFLVVESRRAGAGRPVIADLGLFRLTTFRAGVVAALVVAFGEFGLLFTLPLLLQGTLGYSALGTGGIIAALALGTFLVSGAIPRISERLSPRLVVQIGLAFEVIAVAGLALSLSLDIPVWLVAAWLFLYGAGVGMATAQLTSLLLRDVPAQQSGQASGLQSSVRQVGSALGVALLGGLLVGNLARQTRENLQALNLDGSQIEAITAAVKESAGIHIAALQAPGGEAAIARAAGEAMIHASQLTTGAAAAALALGLLASFALPREAPKTVGPQTVSPQTTSPATDPSATPDPL
ncbi:MAG: MFS transporter [Nocardioides sp.]